MSSTSFPDELTLARAQLDAGQPALAEGTLRSRIAYREAEGPVADDELDALRALLAESLWRQGRLVIGPLRAGGHAAEQPASAAADRHADRGGGAGRGRRARSRRRARWSESSRRSGSTRRTTCARASRGG